MSLLKYTKKATENKDSDQPVKQDVKQNEENVKQPVKQDKKEPRDVEKKVTSNQIKLLTSEMVLDFIKSSAGKKTGYASLYKLITRHKAVSISMLQAIIDIHREFREYL